MDDAMRRRVFADLERAVGTKTATILMEGWPMDAAVLATKEDLRRLRLEFRSELRATEHRLERQINESVTDVKTELGERIHNVEVQVGQFLVQLAATRNEIIAHLEQTSKNLMFRIPVTFGAMLGVIAGIRALY